MAVDHPVLEFIVGELVDLSAGETALDLYAHLVTDVKSNTFRVSREHNGIDTVVPQFLDGALCACLRRVKESDESHQNHVCLMDDSEGSFIVYLILLCNSEDSQALFVVLFIYAIDFLSLLIIEKGYLSVHVDVFADRYDLVNGSFCDELSLVIAVTQHHAHPSPGKVERDLVLSCVDLLEYVEAFLLSP